HRVLQRRAGDAHAACSDVDAAELEAAEHLLQAASFDPAHEIGGGHAVALKRELRAVDALVSELFQLAAGGESGTLLADEDAHSAVRRLRLRVGLRQQ